MAEIASVPHEAKIAFLLDYDSLWALRLQPHHRDFEYMRHLFVYYRALQRLGHAADIVSVAADLSPYKLIIVPTAFVATEQLVRTLQEFAEAGGTVLLGVRSGFKTASNRFTDRPLPGPLRNLVGVTVSEWQSLPTNVSIDLSSNVPGLAGSARIWAESLDPVISNPQSGGHDLHILASYTSGPYNSKAALVERQVGGGRALYLGWYPSDAQAEAILAYLASQSGFLSLAAVPEGMIVSQRGPYLILLNFTEHPLEATVHGQPVRVGSRDVMVINEQAR